mmetsp:Transcript_6220/g.12702  ORF Transcript_6220/g.12702 Transcript_6220/m.12702 type:complete len:93 (-) Transcript_6220:150-428(-)
MIVPRRRNGISRRSRPKGRIKRQFHRRPDTGVGEIDEAAAIGGSERQSQQEEAGQDGESVAFSQAEVVIRGDAGGCCGGVAVGEDRPRRGWC